MQGLRKNWILLFGAAAHRTKKRRIITGVPLLCAFIAFTNVQQKAWRMAPLDTAALKAYNTMRGRFLHGIDSINRGRERHVSGRFPF